MRRNVLDWGLAASASLTWVSARPLKAASRGGCTRLTGRGVYPPTPATQTLVPVVAKKHRTAGAESAESSGKFRKIEWS
jgi:hypothetical protein